jgi:hypothetical protein
MIITRIKSLRNIGILTVLLLAFSTDTALAGAQCDNQPIFDFGLGISGSATMCVTPGGLKAQMRAQGLVPGDAYTVWWIYIDDPSQCVLVDDSCDYSFFFNNGDPLAAFGRMSSGIANEDGELHFGDKVNGMRASSGSEVWLLIMHHGPAAENGRALARQLLTPEDPIFGAPHLGIFGGELATPAAATFHVIE